MNLNVFKKLFPNASKSLLELNFPTLGARPVAQLESNPGHESLAKEKVQGRTGPRFLVRFTSVRKRLLDEDNLCEKFHGDLLRYAGIIPGDSPDEIKIETGQRKAGKKEPETIDIEIFEL